ncbi:MAG: RNA-binding transcriptional accessory protein [Bacteroidetes bacterium]|nr:RNA-binding transcriptional accessory protein [Bacteroidota bacterium]MBI3483173.1 RNA-binding transcriptional accessory protein [Bacteroidota bacterium]
MERNIQRIASELKLTPQQVEVVINLLAEGATIPFMARYRKELTGSLDEVALAVIRDRHEQLAELDSRKEAVLKSIEKQERLTPELAKLIEGAQTMAELEDIYLPYKPKRKTRASIAKEKGLEPLAVLIFEQNKIDLERTAATYINNELGVLNTQEALDGARDIMAEWISENQEARKNIRELFWQDGLIQTTLIKSKAETEEAQKFKDYFDWKEPIKKTPSHRLLAMRRAEKEGFILLDISPTEELAIQLLEKKFIKSQSPTSEQVKLSIKDCYKRLLKPTLESEVRMETKMQADIEAIKVFAANLKKLLLASPLGQKRVLALDPGFRSGIKVVCLGAQGELQFDTVIYPLEPQRETSKSATIILGLCDRFKIEAIAIGNGTASRETESFIKSVGLPKEIIVVMVNESGASVYSASEVAREEFPDHDITVRGAVSIGRRLTDPLAELVKIDAKSIGVGQYQHDVDQTKLKAGLDDVVMSCVNSVGVELNTASKELLSYVSGLGPQLAKNIVAYRNQHGAFKSRKELTKVPRLGDKAFEQCAGFLRVRDSKNPLDASAVHPERYDLVEKFASDLGCSVKDLMTSTDLRKKLDLKKYVTDTVGLPTLTDILAELEKPGRDPREKFEVFSFEEGVNEIKDLKVGMVLPGIVTNVTNFGAFVDVGVHQDGLVHISHLADKFVKDPNQVVAVQQKVRVTVMEVDVPRKRIALSMKSDPFGGGTSVKEKSMNTVSEKPKPKPQPRKEESMEDKLAQLKNKFKK